MKIQVAVGSAQPEVYELTQEATIVGSGVKSDIRVPPETGVSRKHMMISMEQERVYITDLGTTNGTFINEERIKPGDKIELTSFFPVRLGGSVFLSLYTDEDRAPADQTSTTAKTKVIPAKRASVDKALRAGAQGAKPVPTKKYSKAADASRMRTTILFLVAVGAGVYGYENYFKEQPPVEVAEVAPVPVKKVTVIKAPATIAKTEFPSVEEFARIMGELKCTTATEQGVCGLLPELAQAPSGAVQDIGRLYVLLDEYKWHRLFGDMSAAMTAQYRTQMLTYLVLNAMPEYNWKGLEKNVFFTFYSPNNESGKSEMSAAVGIKSEELQPLISNLSKDIVSQVQSQGYKALEKLTPFSVVVKEALPFVLKQELEPAPAPVAETAPAAEVPSPEQEAAKAAAAANDPTLSEELVERRPPPPSDEPVLEEPTEEELRLMREREALSLRQPERIQVPVERVKHERYENTVLEAAPVNDPDNESKPRGGAKR